MVQVPYSLLVSLAWLFFLPLEMALSLNQSHLTEEATIFTESSDQKSQAAQLAQEGNRYKDQKRYQKALATYQKALARYRKLLDKASEADLLQRIGSVYENLDKVSDALQVYQQALTIYRQLGDRFQEASALVNVGAMLELSDNYPQALEAYKQALSIRQSLNDLKGAARTVISIGGVYYQQGQLQQALETYQRALLLNQKVGDRIGEGRSLTNLGMTYNDLGKYHLALATFQQSLTIFQQQGNLPEIGAIFNSLGLVHTNLGQYDQALAFFQKALAIWQQLENRSEQGYVLLNMGPVYIRTQQYPKALDTGEHALRLFQLLGDREGQAATLNNQGYAYNKLGQRTKALESLYQSLRLFQALGDQLGEGNVLDSLGSTYRDAKQYATALNYYHQALMVTSQTGDRAAAALTLSNQGELFKLQNQSVLAIFFYKQSINITESIRAELKSLPLATQQLYTQTIADRYRTLADLLLQQDRVLEAQQVLDLLKVQELQDYLQNVRGGEQNLYELPPEQAILKKYNELQKSAIQLGQELADLRKIPDTNRTPAQQQRITQLVKLQDELNQQFNAFTDRSDVVALVKQLTPTVLRQTLDLTQLDALRNDLRQLNAVLLYPLVLDDRLELVITTPDSPPLRRTVSIKREELNATIVEFRRALQDPGSDAKSPAQKLYSWLIKPLEADLKQANAKTIIYAPDGQLRYIPLQALHDSQQWLVQRYRINNITARSFTEFKTQPIKQPHILAGAFAKGEYTFQVGDRSLTFRGLPFAGSEVDALAALVPTTKKLVDQLFNRDTTTTQMNEFNVVHLATHANFVPGIATDSFIVFGNGEKATLKDIESWSLNNVDLVVLSACETGLGGKFGNGEEVLGLGYQFQNRGAKAAIASLWSVDDGGTETLMTAFYQALKQGNLTKAEALQKAQIAIITGKSQHHEPSTPRTSVVYNPGSGQNATLTRNLSHPYYWAPFILIGNGL
ncbi:MAG: hypothetical protein B0A82_08375 [Alkalinema sp. CACIAM 70d]|nr:MAG: hypothetical protein B0A82_08375 [Alkalinema sp. CACIAM 70d]